MSGNLRNSNQYDYRSVIERDEVVLENQDDAIRSDEELIALINSEDPLQYLDRIKHYSQNYRINCHIKYFDPLKRYFDNPEIIGHICEVFHDVSMYRYREVMDYIEENQLLPTIYSNISNPQVLCFYGKLCEKSQEMLQYGYDHGFIEYLYNILINDGPWLNEALYCLDFFAADYKSIDKLFPLFEQTMKIASTTEQKYTAKWAFYALDSFGRIDPKYGISFFNSDYFVTMINRGVTADISIRNHFMCCCWNIIKRDMTINVKIIEGTECTSPEFIADLVIDGTDAGRVSMLLDYALAYIDAEDFYSQLYSIRIVGELGSRNHFYDKLANYGFVEKMRDLIDSDAEYTIKMDAGKALCAVLQAAPEECLMEYFENGMLDFLTSLLTISRSELGQCICDVLSHGLVFDENNNSTQFAECIANTAGLLDILQDTATSNDNTYNVHGVPLNYDASDILNRL